MSSVSIIDYGMGNLRSVENALDFLGVAYRLINHPSDVSSADKLILPGVGAFQQAISNLEQSGLAAATVSAAKRGTPLLGICLGMQLLADSGEEHGFAAGLGLIRGTVKLLAPGPGLRIPHMGFNEVEQVQTNVLFDGIENGSHFYFAHSYYMECSDGVVTGVATHGVPFAAAVANGNVFGTQFHPEKSQSHGLRLLRNFCDRMPC